jgi:hypothetical protein
MSRGMMVRPMSRAAECHHLRQPPPLRPQRLRPVLEGPQDRSINRPHIRPPEAVPIWLDTARPGDLQLPEFPQVQLFAIHTSNVTASIDDELYLGGHTATPTLPRLRMFLRGRSTSISPTLA